MSLFGLGKKKEVKEPSCCCGSVDAKVENSCCCSSNKTEEANCCCGNNVESVCCVKVLGSGCKSCHTLYENAKQAVLEAELNIEVEYITDMEKVMEYGVMSMPALVINDKVVAMGKVLKAEEVKKYLV